MNAPGEKQKARGRRSRGGAHDRPLRLIVKIDQDAPPVDLPTLRSLLVRLAIEAWRRDKAAARRSEGEKRQDVAPAA